MLPLLFWMQSEKVDITLQTVVQEEAILWWRVGSLKWSGEYTSIYKPTPSWGAIHYMGKSTKLGYKLRVPHPHYGKPSVLNRKKSETHKNWNWMHLINDIFESKVTSNKKLFCHIIAFNYSIWKRFFLLRKK